MGCEFRRAAASGHPARRHMQRDHGWVPVARVMAQNLGPETG